MHTGIPQYKKSIQSNFPPKTLDSVKFFACSAFKILSK